MTWSDLNPDQELKIMIELDALEQNPQGYLAAVMSRMIEQFHDESHKPVAERDYDQAMLSVTRALMAIQVWIKQHDQGRGE